jgi:hypothetical protein
MSVSEQNASPTEAIRPAGAGAVRRTRKQASYRKARAVLRSDANFTFGWKITVAAPTTSD